MRPHVELIAEDDYVWHAAEPVGGEGRASERRLSVDKEDDSSSLRVDFHAGWGGDAENYGETGPIPSTLPVRSRSRGGWRGWDGM